MDPVSFSDDYIFIRTDQLISLIYVSNIFFVNWHDSFAMFRLVLELSFISLKALTYELNAASKVFMDIIVKKNVIENILSVKKNFTYQI